MPLTLRNAIHSDSVEIARLTNELGYSADPKVISERLAGIAGRREQLVLVAILEESVVGWLQAHASVALESGLRVEIVGLIVTENARREGIGRSLVQRAEQWARELGAMTVIVRSNTQRIESHHFYPALGFSTSKTQTVYRKHLMKDQDSLRCPQT